MHYKEYEPRIFLPFGSCKSAKNVKQLACDCHVYFTQLTLYPIDVPFDAFANGADPDQAALIRAA